MNPNSQLLHRFYTAFQQLDWRTMADCYHPDARFSDPAFTLAGTEIGMMWRMLCERAQNFELEFQLGDADEQHGTVSWQATYLFSTTGRKVENRIEASITFKDGLIYEHRDRFNFWRWSRQALGVPGLLLGWMPLMRHKVSQQAHSQLNKFIARNSAPTKPA